MSEATSIALHALAYVASRDETVNAAGLAKICGASQAHTMKVCQRLNKAGILSARRGPGGGFALARDATSIRLREIYVIFDGPMEVGHCMFATPVCREQDMHNCIFGDKMARINRQIVQYFDETTLSDIAANCHRALAVEPK
jgi:Rrf2 family protein